MPFNVFFFLSSNGNLLGVLKEVDESLLRLFYELLVFLSRHNHLLRGLRGVLGQHLYLFGWVHLLNFGLLLFVFSDLLL